MLPWLVYLSFSAVHIKYEKPSESDAAFDLIYVDKDNKEHSLTNGKGYYIAVRPYSNGQPGNITLVKHNQPTTIDGVLSIAPISAQSVENEVNQKIEIAVTNLNSIKQLQYDLGVFCDINIDSNTNAILKKVLNGNGVKSSDATPIIHLLKGTYYPNVDTMNLGAFADSAKKDPLFYPYFENNNRDATEAKEDSVLSFSWQGRKLNGSATEKLGFYAIIGDQTNLRPFVHDLTVKKNGLPLKSELKFEVFEYDAQNVTLTVTIDDYTFTGTFESDGKDKVSHVFTVPFEFGSKRILHFRAQATDSDHYLSDPVEGNLLSGGAAPPTLTVYYGLPERLDLGEIYDITVGVDDEYYVSLKCQYDNSEIYTIVERFITIESGVQYPTFYLQLPEGLEIGKTYTFKLWAEDEYGQRSNNYTQSVTLNIPSKPTIISAYLSEEKIVKGTGDQLVIYGEAVHPTRGSNLVIGLTSPLDGQFKKFEPIIATGTTQTFAYFFDVPETLAPGHYSIILEATDNGEQYSGNQIELVFIVYDPNAKPPVDDYGKIVDVTQKTLNRWSKTLFNLRWEKDFKEHKMTYNDEGFYAGFRVYDDARPQSTNHITFNEGKQMIEKDNFTIKFSTKQDEDSNNLFVQFKVINNNFFSKKIDLGVFADSFFSTDDNASVTPRPDGRGFSVYNSLEDISYTIFTKGYYPFPDVKTTFIGIATRDSNGQIPEANIPFFANYNKAAKGINKAYGFSWTAEIEPNIETLFGFVVAGHNNTRTPARLTDLTSSVTPSYVKPDTEITIRWSIRDADIGDKLVYELRLYNNEGLIDRVPGNMEVKSNQAQQFSHTINIGKNPFVTYQIKCQDADGDAFFPSNVIRGTISATAKPFVHFEDLRKSYHNKENITVTGLIDDDNSVTLMYKFFNGTHYSTTFTGPTIKHGENDTTTFKFDIPIPSALQPRKENWKVVIWGEDEYYIKSDESSFEFRLNPYNPPKIVKAGLSKKTAKAGEKLIAFASVSDKEDDELSIYVRIGDQPYKEMPQRKYMNNVQPGKSTPVGFYWSVPSDLAAGNYQVYFQVRDSDGLPSAEISKSLTVTN